MNYNGKKGNAGNFSVVKIDSFRKKKKRDGNKKNLATVQPEKLGRSLDTLIN